ncbi:TPA: hypothetical protein ACFRHF_002153, partial [Neisseria lactamica]
LHRRRFVSSEDANYTLEDVYGQYFQWDFFKKFVISLSDKVFLFLPNAAPPPKIPSSSPLTGAPL